MAQSLTEHERDLLINLRDQHPDPSINRRAQIVLLAAEDTSTADMAQAIALSAGQIRHWRREWDDRRMDIFPEEALAYVVDGGQPAASAPDHSVAVPSQNGKKRKKKTLAPVPLGDAALEAFEDPSAPGVGAPRLALELRNTVGIEPGDSMAEAGRKTLLFHFERMLLNEPGSRLGEDIEAVHDMRVATRRMRSAFRLFEPYYKPVKIAPFRGGLKKIGGVLGDVRDLDVFMEKAQAFAQANPDVDLAPLVEAWQKRLGKARQRLIEHLDSAEFAHFVADFHAFLTTPGKGSKPLPAPEDLEPFEVRHVLPQLIYELYEQVRVYDGFVTSSEVATLHALRIEFKRLRYALEFFEEVLGPEGRAVIKEVKGMQDHLGDLNDAEVAEQILQDFVTRYDEKQSGMPRFMRQPDISGVAVYLRAKQAEKQHLLDTFPEAWAKFSRDEVRRNLALAVAAL